MLSNFKKIMLLILCITFIRIANAEISLSGYTEFAAGSADQSISQGSENHGNDLAGMHNGTYSRITADYTTTLDSGIEVSGTYVFGARDCKGSNTGNCNVVDYNFATFSGGFGSISIGERFAAGATMLSRLTAGVPTAEPDGGLYTGFFENNGLDSHGSGNEVDYADASMKIHYASNIYNGFSFAVSYTPNRAEDGDNTTDGQVGSGSSWAAFNDIVSAFAKYSLEMDGFVLDLVYGQQSGNAGIIGSTSYNDLEETAYSAAISYGAFSADYRKNEAGDSGQEKNSNAGNDEGTSYCLKYTLGNGSLGGCNVSTNFTDTSNLSNDGKTRTYSADYSLGGGATVGLLYFDVEQTANGTTMTDAEGIMSMISLTF